MKIMAPISLGELVDKITILEIKFENVEDPTKRHNIRVELDELNLIYEPIKNRQLENFHLELKEVNKSIWDVEEDIRVIMYKPSPNENGGASGSPYNDVKKGYNLGQLSEQTHRLNDQRAYIKKQINTQFGSTIIEEKIYKGSNPWQNQS